MSVPYRYVQQLELEFAALRDICMPLSTHQVPGDRTVESHGVAFIKFQCYVNVSIL